MTLYTKCILAPAVPEDGIRVSVMSRHTLNDGLTPDPRITVATYDKHMPWLAPPPKLVGAYYKHNMPWEEFEKQYNFFLKRNNVVGLVRQLAYRSLEETLTIMCIEETPEKCHRRLLAEACKEHQPRLEVVIL